MRELTNEEIRPVAGGQSINLSGPSSPGILSGNVVRLLSDAANDAKAVRSDLRGRTAAPIALDFIAAALLFLPTVLAPSGAGPIFSD
jgi:hypothetical protein